MKNVVFCETRRTLTWRQFILACTTLAALPVLAANAPAEKKLTPDEIAFFEKKIRPVLAQNCYKCHSAEAEKIKGGLTLDTREGIRMGGDTGHAIVPGDVKGSLLIKAIHWEDTELQMPPKKSGGKLSDEVIADFEKWVKMGAPDPREGKAVTHKGIDVEKGRNFWAFQPPQKSAPPAVKNSGWAHNDIDRFVLAELEAKKLKPVADADKPALIRRVYFDLIGLPPTPEQVETFVKNTAPNAYVSVVDTLLASPQFGERWGRHWLDVARYAESSGKEVNMAYPHAWRYRDYVIASFNQDKPYNQFIKEQIAGDLIPAKSDQEFAEHLIATGYLAIGPKSHNSRDRRQFNLDVADEQIDTISQGMQGMTVACARCHDHKFDPIPTHDYYALAGIFLSTETLFGTPRIVQNNMATSLLELPDKAVLRDPPVPSKEQLATLKGMLDKAKKDRDEILQEARTSKDASFVGNPKFLRANGEIGTFEKLLERYDADGKPIHLVMGVQDRNYPGDTQILARGELDKPGETVPRGYLQVLNTSKLSPIKKGSGRKELAEALASPANPLTARVMVNRIWLHLFDRGIVPTPDNFGSTGQLPSNQKLLDYLAVSFVENGWSVKKTVREMVLSHTYQLGSAYDAKDYAADPDNILHWRMSQRRLDAEAIRDAMLQISGRLELTPPVGTPVARIEGRAEQLLRPRPGMPGAPGRFGGPPARGRNGEDGNQLTADTPFRSVYLPIVRDQVPDALEVFDFAEPSLVTGDRDDTTVPSQALYLMNSTVVERLAEGMTDRLLEKQMTGLERTKLAFMLAYSRPPTENEITATTSFFKRFYEAEGTREMVKDRWARSATVAFCQALLGSAEFRYLY